MVLQSVKEVLQARNFAILLFCMFNCFTYCKVTLHGFPPLISQSLVDDDLVHQEKIGISNFFWSFPSEAAVKLDGEMAKLTARLRTRQTEEAKLRSEVEASMVGKEDSVRD